MKLKFRADKKDIIIFIIFCIFLLYLVAIGVLNLHYFSNYSYFWGLNPFPAFSSEFIVTTLLFYLLALVGLMAGASSYFFEREKGFGVTTKKKEDPGWSRWMNEKEMKEAYNIKKIKVKDEDYPHGGVPIINKDGKEIWVDDGENHTLIVGATGSGKTAAILDAQVKILTRHGESMIVTDPKGEIYERNANLMREKGYKVIIINFRDPKLGSSWNPFSLPYRLYKEGNKDKAQELLEDLGMNILVDPNNKNDPFWENSARDYFVGLSLGLFEDAKDESEINLNSINAMATFGDDKIGGKTYLQEYLKIKGELSPVYISANATVNAPADTKGGIVSVFRQKVRIFSSRENISEMLSYTDFDMRDFGKEKTAVFLKVHDEKTTYHALATIFIKQVYESLIDVAQKEENLKLKVRMNFLLDEFPNMPALKDVETMITASRSRNIRFTFVIQNFAQLTRVYGKETAETIKGNSQNLIYLMTTEYQALEEISKLCGEAKPKEQKDKPTPAPRPLVTISDLQQMKRWEVIIKRQRNHPFKTKVKPSFEIDWNIHTENSGYSERETREVSVFDIKKYVMDHRPEPDMSNMFGGPSPYPFAPAFSGMQTMNPRNVEQAPIDVDDLVKKIDAKIAELEKEEEEQNKIIDEKIKESENELLKPIPEVTESQKETVEKIVDNVEQIIEENKELENVDKKEQIKEEVEKPKINIDVDSIIVDDNITDDDFFDDFFDDGDEE